MKTYYLQDYRDYTVSATAAGYMSITSASHPTSVKVGQENSWSLVAKVTGGYVRNPCISYCYKDGPASSITIVKKDGSTGSLAKGASIIMYIKGDVDEGTTIDSTGVYRGVIFPSSGSYSIQLGAGYLSDTEAAAGSLTLGGYFEHVTTHVVTEGIPVTVSAEAAWDVAKLVGAFTPFIVVGGAILVNELHKVK